MQQYEIVPAHFNNRTYLSAMYVKFTGQQPQDPPPLQHKINDDEYLFSIYPIGDDLAAIHVKTKEGDLTTVDLQIIKGSIRISNITNKPRSEEKLEEILRNICPLGFIIKKVKSENP